MIRHLVTSSVGQQVKFRNELHEALSSLFEHVQLGHGSLLFCGVLKETGQDRRELCIALVIEVAGQVTSYPVDDFQGCSFVHVRQEKPLLVVVILEGHCICLDVRFALSLEHTPILWVSIESIREGNVLFDSGGGSSGGLDGCLYLQMVQDGIRVVEVCVQRLEQLILC